MNERVPMHNDLAYAPFGETYAQAGSTGVTQIAFAGNSEDTTASLYDAQFREYGIQGRWPSPDPAGVAAANPANPQSWNRYAYVMNNPLSFFDPSGLDCWLTGLYFPVPCPDVTSITVNGSPFNFVGAAGDGSSRLANPIEIFMGGPKGGGSFGDLCGGGDCVNPDPPQAPQTQAQRQKGFNQCVAQAAQTEHHALANSIAEEAAGGLGILFSVGTGAASFEVAGEELASGSFFQNLSGIELTSRLTSIYTVKGLLFGGVYVKGIADTTKALNQYDSNVAGCQAQFGYPNVP